MNSERRQEGCKIYQNLAPKNNLRGHLALQQKDMSGSLKAKWGMFGAFWFNVEYWYLSSKFLHAKYGGSTSTQANRAICVSPNFTDCLVSWYFWGLYDKGTCQSFWSVSPFWRILLINIAYALALKCVPRLQEWSTWVFPICRAICLGGMFTLPSNRHEVVFRGPSSTHVEACVRKPSQSRSSSKIPMWHCRVKGVLETSRGIPPLVKLKTRWKLQNSLRPPWLLERKNTGNGNIPSHHWRKRCSWAS